MPQHRNTMVSVCLMAALACSCAGRMAAPRSAYGPVKPSSLEEYIRAVYRISAANAHSEKEQPPQIQSPESAELVALSQANPLDRNLKSRLATAYLERNLYREAYDLLMDLHASEPEDRDTNLRLAQIWDQWEQHALALQHVTRAIEAGAASHDAFALMARIQLHLNQFDAAISWYRRSLESNPRDATVLANLGYAYILKSDWPQARQHLEAAIAIDNAMPEVHNNLAGVLSKIGDNAGALRHLMEAGTPQVAMNNMGVLYLQQNRLEDAQHYFRESLRLDPTYMTAQRNLQLAQRLTPPPSIIELPASRESVSLTIAPPLGGKPTVESIVAAVAAVRGSSTRPPQRAVKGAEAASGEHADEYSDGTEDRETPAGSVLAAAGTRTDASGAVGAAEPALPHAAGPVSQRAAKPVGANLWDVLKQERHRLNLAGVAGLVLLTGLLALRPRKSRD